MSVLETRWNGQIWVYPLDGDRILVGSDPRAQVSLRHPSISPSHCHLRKKAGLYILTDLSEGAGTFLNGQRVREAPLRDRDVLQIGSVRLSYADSAILEGPRVFCPVEVLPVAMEVERGENPDSHPRAVPRSLRLAPPSWRPVLR